VNPPGPWPECNGGLRFLRRSRHKAVPRKQYRVLIVLLLALSAWPFIAWAAAQLLIVKTDLRSADAIVVLSGSSTFVERSNWAARLFRQGSSTMIILTNDGLISGWNRAEERNPHFYELAARELRECGVPVEKIQVVPGIAAGTYAESLAVRDYATEHKLNRLMIVTSAYHSRRALWSMRQACAGSGIEIGIDCPPPGWQTPSAWTWWLHRWGWRVVAAEYAKIVYYWWNY